MVKKQIIPQAVKQMFELDFSENEKGTALFREDLQFYDTVKRGIIHLEDLHYEMPLPFKHQNIPRLYWKGEYSIWSQSFLANRTPFYLTWFFFLESFSSLPQNTHPAIEFILVGVLVMALTPSI